MAIKNAKIKCWQELCRTIEEDPWGLAYKIVTKKLLGRKPIPGVTEPTWAKQIVETLFPTRERRTRIKTERRVVTQETPFSSGELREAAKSLKLGKAPGPDMIPNEVLKLVVEEWPEFLLETYNACLRDGRFPNCWKEQTLVLLHKTGKPLNEPSSYRPLCMLDSLGKMLEKLIANRLSQQIETQGGLSDRQYGFRRGRSTIDAIATVVANAKRSQEQKGFCAVITIDVKNAFNTAK